MPAIPCPEEAALRGYLLGAIGAVDQTAVSDHLGSCPACLARAQALDDGGDPLVARLRRPLAAVETEPALRAALARLEAGPEGPGGPQPGQQVGEYLLLAKLGEGGMGAVFRAIHQRLQREVALKVLPGDRAGDRAARARFEREMRAVGRLRHPHIVQATDAGEADGVVFLVMEQVAGVDLARLVRDRGPLPVADACELVRQAALALQHAHEQGLVHRDVKPSNLMLTPDGTVKLLDLGLALLRNEPEAAADAAAVTRAGDEALTTPSLLMGTRDYMAPEQRTDAHGVDARADLYGLGCTLHFLLTGHPPRPGAALRDRRPDAPSALAELLGRLLAEDPGHRPPTAAAAAADLRRFARGHDVPALLTGTPARRRRRRRAGAGALAALVLAGAGAAAFTLRHRAEPAVADGPAAPTAPARTVPPPGRLPMTADQARQLQQQWADALNVPVAVTDAAGLSMVLVPPGEFLLWEGTTATFSRPFRISATEVTRGQFGRFVAATKYVTATEKDPRGGTLRLPDGRLVQRGNHWRNTGFAADDPDDPVVFIHPNDATAFCNWLSDREWTGYTMPTLAQWRWACRAGSAGRYSHGDDVGRLTEFAWTAADSGLRPRPVGRKAPNAWGLSDTLGNVAEWVRDWDGPQAPLGRVVDWNRDRGEGDDHRRWHRLACGGHYLGREPPANRWSGGAHCDEVTRMINTNPPRGDAGVGFRVVCDLK